MVVRVSLSTFYNTIITSSSIVLFNFPFSKMFYVCKAP